jgi:hypothetical protein
MTLRLSGDMKSLSSTQGEDATRVNRVAHKSRVLKEVPLQEILQTQKAILSLPSSAVLGRL